MATLYEQRSSIKTFSLKTVEGSTSSKLLAFTLFFFLAGSVAPFKKQFFILMFLVYFIFALASFKENIKLLVSSKSLLLLWFLFVASYFWTLVPSATIDAIRYQSTFFLFALWVSVHHRQFGFYQALRSAVAGLLIIVLLYCLLNPGALLASSGLKAFYPHKNTFGTTMAICALVLFYAPNKTKWHLGMGLATLALLFASQSKTSISVFFVSSFLCVIASGFVKLVYHNTQKMSLSIIVRKILWVSFLVGLIAMVIFRDEILQLIWAELPKTALTGRGQLWLLVIQQVRSSSLLGIGPGVFWQAGAASEIAQTILYQFDPIWLQTLISSDGSYADIIASLGMLGLALFLLTTGDLYRRIFRNWKQNESRLIFTLVTFVLLHGISETTILYSRNVNWLIYLLCYFRVVGFLPLNSSLSQKIKLENCLR